MNKNQYFTTSIFIFIMMFLIPMIITSGISAHHDSVYFGVRDGILSVMMWMSWPLMILFVVLGLLEEKK